MRLGSCQADYNWPRFKCEIEIEIESICRDFSWRGFLERIRVRCLLMDRPSHPQPALSMLSTNKLSPDANLLMWCIAMQFTCSMGGFLWCICICLYVAFCHWCQSVTCRLSHVQTCVTSLLSHLRTCDIWSVTCAHLWHGSLNMLLWHIGGVLSMKLSLQLK